MRESKLQQQSTSSTIASCILLLRLQGQRYVVCTLSTLPSNCNESEWFDMVCSTPDGVTALVEVM